MKLRPAARDAESKYPSFDDYLKNRSSILRKMAIGAGVVAIGAAGAFAGEKDEPKVQGKVRQARPVQVEVRLKGDVVAPVAPKEVEEAKPVKPLTEKQVKEAEELVGLLGSDDFQAREDAQKKLEAMGPGVVAVLEKHKNADDAEVRSRVEAIVESFDQAKKREIREIQVMPRMAGVMAVPAEPPKAKGHGDEKAEGAEKKEAEGKKAQ